MSIASIVAVRFSPHPTRATSTRPHVVSYVLFPEPLIDFVRRMDNETIGVSRRFVCSNAFDCRNQLDLYRIDFLIPKSWVLVEKFDKQRLCVFTTKEKANWVFAGISWIGNGCVIFSTVRLEAVEPQTCRQTRTGWSLIQGARHFLTSVCLEQYDAEAQRPDKSESFDGFAGATLICGLRFMMDCFPLVAGRKYFDGLGAALLIVLLHVIRQVIHHVRM